MKLDRQASEVDSGGMGFFKPTKLKIFIALLLFLFLAPFINVQCLPFLDPTAPNPFHCSPIQISPFYFILIRFNVSPFTNAFMSMDYQYALNYPVLLLSLLLAYPISCIFIFLVKSYIKPKKAG